jgi:hypothetical protein
MPIIYRVNITAQNCFKCKYFRRDNLGLDPNQGTCIAIAPKARGAVSDTGNQDDINAHIQYPAATYCGSFEPWDGTARVVIPVVE